MWLNSVQYWRNICYPMSSFSCFCIWSINACQERHTVARDAVHCDVGYIIILTLSVASYLVDQTSSRPVGSRPVGSRPVGRPSCTWLHATDVQLKPLLCMEKGNYSGEQAIHCGHGNAHEEYVMRRRRRLHTGHTDVTWLKPSHRHRHKGEPGLASCCRTLHLWTCASTYLLCEVLCQSGHL